MSDCPNTEKLSEFIDARLFPEEREKIAAHLGDCAECYSVVAESLAIREEMAFRSRARVKKYLYYSVPASMAAAAVMLFTLRVYQPVREFNANPARNLAYQAAPSEKKPLPKQSIPASTPSFAYELSSSLAGDVNALLLARIAEKRIRPAPVYGFSSVVPLEKTAFRIGARLTDLEVALKAKDKGNSEICAKQLVELLKPLESSHGPLPMVIQEANRYEAFSSAVEALFRNRKEAVFVSFGAWVEAAELAADAGQAEFFRPAVVRQFKMELETSGVPIGTLKNLSQLETIPTSGATQAEQCKTSARLLADIKEMF